MFERLRTRKRNAAVLAGIAAVALITAPLISQATVMADDVDLVVDYEDPRGVVAPVGPKGDFKLTKVDQFGNQICNWEVPGYPGHITDDQPAFLIWYYDQAEGDSYVYRDKENRAVNFVVRDSSKSTDEAPVYGVRRYDGYASAPEYYIFTKGGVLEINDTMPAGITYYIQEMEAPTGYEKNDYIYVVCSGDQFSSLGYDIVENPFGESAPVKWAGAGVTLTDCAEVTIANRKIHVESGDHQGVTPSTPSNLEPEKPATPSDLEPDEPVRPATPSVIEKKHSTPSNLVPVEEPDDKPGEVEKKATTSDLKKSSRSSNGGSSSSKSSHSASSSHASNEHVSIPSPIVEVPEFTEAPADDQLPATGDVDGLLMLARFGLNMSLWGFAVSRIKKVKQ